MKLLRLLLLTCLPSLIQAQTLVQNLDASFLARGNKIGRGLMHNGILYFPADDGTNGIELWRTDGTSSGTYLLRDICAGKESSTPAGFTVYNGEVFFTATDGLLGREVWKTDGTPDGTRLLADVRPGKADGNPLSLTVVNGFLYFTSLFGPAILGTAEGYDRQLWRSNGTEAGTQRAIDMWTSNDDRVENLIAFEGQLFFSGRSANRSGLWRLTGSGDTVFVQTGTIGNPTISIGSLFFRTGGSSSPNNLYRYQGGTSSLLKTFDAFNGFSLVSMADVNGTLFMAANADAANSDVELWKSDGTAPGTVLVKDIRPGLQSSGLTSFFPIGNLLYFTADNGTNGRELWKSDGSDAGTVLVKDVQAGGSAGLTTAPEFSLLPDGFVYFIGGTGELWRSNGTDAGTMQVHDFLPGTGSSNVSGLSVVGNKIVLSANSPGIGIEPWITDGTSAGTELLKNLNADERSSFLEEPSTDLLSAWYGHSNGRLYFAASDGIAGNELWSTAGVGATRVRDIRAGSIGSYPEHLVNGSGKIQFRADDNLTGDEWWITDGSEANTSLLRDIRPAGSSFPQNSRVINGITYFSANDNTHGQELWRSDGTTAGTYMVKDIRPGSANAALTNLTVVGDLLFFTANDGVSGQELWKSDGTEAGTVLVRDMVPGAGGAFGNNSPSNELVNIDGFLYFRATVSSSTDLWRSDGTLAGTVRLTNGDYEPKSITGAGGWIYFNGDAELGALMQEELMAFNHTTLQLVRLTNCCPGTSETARPSNLLSLGGKLYATAYSPNTGWELLVANGPSATILDLIPGKESSNPANFVAGLDRIYFAAADREHGVEVWQSDGTIQGTSMVAEVWPGANSSNPAQLIMANRQLFFIADNGIVNYELWGLQPLAQYSLPNSAAQDSILIQWNNLVLTQAGQLLATIKQTGAQPLNDQVHVRLGFDGAVQQYNGRPYAQRHYDIEPERNPSTATATVTLYFSQSEFDAYNLANTGYADLPMSGGDAAGKAALRIWQLHGAGTAPGNYPGAAEFIDPDDNRIRWNSTGNYWEVEFEVTGFSGFYLTTIAGSALPVQLLELRAWKEGSGNRLRWQVGEESNMDRYEVERMRADGSFASIGQRQSLNVARQAYTFLDSQPASGRNTYRLRMVEQDASFRYSAIVVVDAGQPSVRIYPLPVKNLVTVDHLNPAWSGKRMRILDGQGRTVTERIISGPIERMDLSSWASGMYYLQLPDGQCMLLQKQ